MKVINDLDGKPIKTWCENLEEGAEEQAANITMLPFLFRHVALMPDCHQGYGMPIGGVAALQGVISPNMVGSDIGCGMAAVRSSVTEISQEQVKAVIGEIRKAVPVGFNRHKEDQQHSDMPEGDFSIMPIVQERYMSALKQVGTLGGGNHFIEIQKGSDDRIWLMLHSGSRNIGYQVARHYNDLAIELNRKWRTSIPEKWELAFLPMDSKEGVTYKQEMDYCLNFALCNRALMMKRVKDIFGDILQCSFDDDSEVNIHHNYAAMENHFGKNVMVHRKGATSAREGEIGIIPGSQGTNSYIVRGKGNEESFTSCSHGAGRRMGRKQAQRELDFEAEKKRLEDRGILHSLRNKKDLDEAPGSYKDINVVMAEQDDLVEIVVKLEPLGVIKG